MPVADESIVDDNSDTHSHFDDKRCQSMNNFNPNNARYVLNCILIWVSSFSNLIEPQRNRDSASSIVKECNATRIFRKPKESTFAKPTITEVKETEEDVNMTLNIPESFKRTCGCSSILIVDDSPFNILILHEIFGKLIPDNLNKNKVEKGKPYLAIDEATNGKHALNKVKETMNKLWWNGYELILMDLNMPVMDGATSAKHIVDLQKVHMVNQSLKIWALTAYDSHEHKKLCKEAGMYGFLNKPVSMKDIIGVLDSY